MYYIGIDLGGTNIAAGIVTEEGKIVVKDSVPTLSERPTDEIVTDMANLSKKLVQSIGIEMNEIKGIGIGCPGTIDFETGEIVYSNNIKINHYPLADKFKEHIPLPVKVDNDANCAALGEYKDTIMHGIVKKEGKISGRTAFEAAKQGDEVAKKVVSNYERYLADGIVSIENIFQPEIIAIGGGISKEGDYLIEPIREYVYNTGFNKHMTKTKIVAAQLFNDAGIIGAAMLAI